MRKRTYPCQRYTLTRNYNVRKVIIARPYSTSYDNGSGYTARGVYYRNSDLFDTKIAAIKTGRAQIRRRQKSLDRGAEEVRKAIAALDKAEAQS